MINYIKSEVYRNLRSKGNYIFLFGCMIFVIFLNIVLSLFLKGDPNFPYATTKYSFSSLYACMGFPMILCLPLASIVFGQEFKHRTLKNSISYGIPRNFIYLGKYLILLSIALINLILISAVYIISGYLLLENSGQLYLNELIRALISGTPLLLVSITLAHSLYFIFENETTVSIYWVIIMIIIPQLSKMLGNKLELFREISTWMPLNMFTYVSYSEETGNLIMYWSSQKGMINCFIVGVVGVITFYIIGMKLFKKVEIK